MMVVKYGNCLDSTHSHMWKSYRGCRLQTYTSIIDIYEDYYGEYINTVAI